MRVLINCHSMPLQIEGAGGAGKYIKALLPSLSKKCELHVICSPRNKSEYSVPNATIHAPGYPSGVWLANVAKNIDIFYDPQNGLNPKDLPPTLPTVVCVHDLQHKSAPQFFSAAEIDARNLEYGFAIGRADGLVAISEWEKSNFARYYGRTDAQVIHHAAYLYESHGNLKGIGEVAREDSDFYIYPAVGWPHKNHYRLIQAFLLFLRRYKLSRRLILTGTVSHSHSSQAWQELLSSSSISGSIEPVGLVSDEELAILFATCRGVLFPSLYEGFGIPVLDAMRFRAPILASHMTAIPEVGGDCISYFSDPMDAESMALDIERFDSNITESRLRLDEAEERAKEYSISSMVDSLLDLFGKVISAERTESTCNGPVVMLNNEARKRLTIIIDCTRNGVPAKKKLVEVLAGIPIFQLCRSTVDFVVVCSPSIREVCAIIDKDLSEDIRFVYHNNDVDTGFPNLWSKHIFEAGINSDYCLFLYFSDLKRLAASTIRKSIAHLDYCKDVLWMGIDAIEKTSAIKVGNAATNLEDRIEAYESYGVNGSAVYGNIFRVSMIEQHGIPGSTAFGSYFSSAAKSLL